MADRAAIEEAVRAHYADAARRATEGCGDTAEPGIGAGCYDPADVIVTMGCGDACPVYPGKRYLDWQLVDPAGRGVEDVRTIRDDIDRRVRALLSELVPVAGA